LTRDIFSFSKGSGRNPTSYKHDSHCELVASFTNKMLYQHAPLGHTNRAYLPSFSRPLLSRGLLTINDIPRPNILSHFFHSPLLISIIPLFSEHTEHDTVTHHTPVCILLRLLYTQHTEVNPSLIFMISSR
jgi:hypothetical protein